MASNNITSQFISVYGNTSIPTSSMNFQSSALTIRQKRQDLWFYMSSQSFNRKIDFSAKSLLIWTRKNDSTFYQLT